MTAPTTEASGPTLRLVRGQYSADYRRERRGAPPVSGADRALLCDDPGCLLLAAGGRDDAVHAEVLDHLAVVVEAVPEGEARGAQARGAWVAAFAGEALGEVGFVEGGHGAVAEDERVLEELDDVGLGGHRVGAVVLLGIDVGRQLLAEDSREDG